MQLDGTWRVWGPGFDVSLLTSRLWANIARSITKSLPRREPYELNSLGTTLRNNRSQATGFLYSLPSVGPGDDPDVQAVSLQVTISHPPGGRLPLLSARHVVTVPATVRRRTLAGTTVYCWWQRHIVNNLPKVVRQLLPRVGFEPNSEPASGLAVLYLGHSK